MSLRPEKKSRVLRILAAPIVLALAGAALIAAPTTAQAASPNPTVSNFAAAPTSLGASGGSVTLSAQVTNATSCAFSSTPALSGLPVTVPCSSGTVSQGITVPANTTHVAKTYHFHLAVSGVAGTTTANAKAVTVTEAGLPPNPTVSNFAAAPTSLGASGGSVTLSAQVTNATSCAFSSTPALSGLPVTVPCSSGTVSQGITVPANTTHVAKTYHFHLAVSGVAGTTTANAKAVTVTEAGLPPNPTVSNFAAAPTSLGASGGSVTLSAQVTNATSCAFSSTPALSGLPVTVPCSSGTVSQGITVPANTTHVAKTYHFHLAVSGVAGTTTANAKAVTVTEAGLPPNPTVSNFAAAPTSLGASGGSVTLSAQVTNATSCAFSSTPALSGLPVTVPCSSGTVSQGITVPANTTHVAKTYHFHLAVSGVAGTTTANAKAVTVTEAGLPPNPTVSNFAAAPTSLGASGGSVTLSAQVTNATSCAFSSTPALSGLPVTVPCSSGTVSQVVSVPGNTGTMAKTYAFHLAVSGVAGTTTVNAKAARVTVAAVTKMPGYGTVQGNVTSQGGLALNGMCLHLFNTTYTKDLVQFAASGNPTNGAFTQAHVPDGTYIGLFENCGANTSGTGPDYNYESVFYGPGSGGPFQPNGAATITVTNGATVDLGTSSIPLGGTVNGTVTDTTAGTPAYPIAVAVEIPGASNYNIDSPGGTGFMIVCAGTDGTYSVSGVPDGAQIVFSPNNWACPDQNGNFNFGFYVQSTSSPVSVTSDGTTTVNGSVSETPPAPSAAARLASPCTGVGPCREG